MNKELMESLVSSFKTKEDAVNFVSSMYDAAQKEKKPAEKEKYYMLVVERFNPHTKNYDYDPVVGLNMTLIYSKNPQEVQAQGDVLIQLSEDAEFDNKVCILAIDEELCMSMDRKFKNFCSELTNLTNDISAVADKYACPSKILSLGIYPKTPSKEDIIKMFFNSKSLGYTFTLDNEKTKLIIVPRTDEDYVDDCDCDCDCDCDENEGGYWDDDENEDDWFF